MSPTVAATLGAQILDGVDGSGAQWTCTGIDGWDGSPSTTLQAVQKLRAPGGWSSPRQLTPRTLAPAGRVAVGSVADLVAARDRLNAAASVAGAVLTVAEGGITRFCTVYRQDAVLFSRLNPVVADWSVQVTALDPRKFAADLTASTGLPSSSGGLTIPFTIPFTIAATVQTGTCSLANPGNISGPVKLRIHGPIVGPQVTHQPSGLVLAFASVTLGALDWLDIDMENQAALANGQAVRVPTVLGWSGFLPGVVNSWSLAAASGTGTVDVTATPAWQ